MGRQGEGSRVDRVPRDGLAGFLGAFRAQTMEVENLPALPVCRGPENGSPQSHRLQLCPRVSVPVPRRMLPASRTRTARAVHTPALTHCLHHPWSERAHQLRVPDLDAQPPGPRVQLLKSYPPMGSSSSRALLARSHASAHRRTGEGAGAAWFPGSICSAPHAVDPVSDSHTAGGPAASKVGDPFLRVAFLFPEAEATTLFLT